MVWDSVEKSPNPLINLKTDPSKLARKNENLREESS